MDKRGIRPDRGCMYRQKFYVFVFFACWHFLFSYMCSFIYLLFFFTNCFFLVFCFNICFVYSRIFVFRVFFFGGWHKTSSISALLIIVSFLKKYGLMQSQQCVSLCHVCISAYQSTFLHVFSCFEIFRDTSRFFEMFEIFWAIWVAQVRVSP